MFPRLPPKLRQWLRGVGLVALLAGLLWTAYQLQTVSTPLLIAAALAYILNPLVTRLEGYGLGRLYTIAAIYAVVTVGIVLLLSFAIPRLVHQMTALPSYAENLVARISQVSTDLMARHKDLLQTDGETGAAETSPDDGRGAPYTRPTDTADRGESPSPWTNQQVRRQVTDFLRKRSLGILNKAYEIVAGIFGSVITIVSVTILIPLYSFFLLWRFNDITSAIEKYLPGQYRRQIVSIVKQIDQATANFFRGQLLVCIAVGLLLSVGWAIVGTPMALVVGITVGILNLVPFLSWIFGLPLCILVCLLAEGGISISLVTWTLIVFVLVQTLESLVLTPAIQGKSVGLHPISTVLALLVGSEVAGIFGMMLAIPAACAAKILFKELILPELKTVAQTDPDTT